MCSKKMQYQYWLRLVSTGICCNLLHHVISTAVSLAAAAFLFLVQTSCGLLQFANHKCERLHKLPLESSKVLQTYAIIRWVPIWFVP